MEEAQAFCDKLGFPVIVKPDNGVGASNTWKLQSEDELRAKYQEVISRYPSRHFIMEEFVPGHIETFAGIVNAEGKVLLFTGQVMKATPLAQLQGTGENVSYTQPVEQMEDLRETGLRTVEAFGVRNRFFHFEFFRLDEAKRGLGKQGDIIGLEVNMGAQVFIVWIHPQWRYVGAEDPNLFAEVEAELLRLAQ